MNVTVESREITPSKIVCIGRNYAEHIQELKNEVPEDMVVFLKPNSSITTQLLSVHDNQPLHYEAEICFLIEKGRYSHVGFGLDLTKRDLQNHLKTKGLPWERSKAFDGSALFSDFVKIPANLCDLRVELELNGKVIQSGCARLMLYSPDQILSELHTFLTLEDGDVVMTGTPRGVGVVHQRDVFTGRVCYLNHEQVSATWTAI